MVSAYESFYGGSPIYEHFESTTTRASEEKTVDDHANDAKKSIDLMNFHGNGRNVSFISSPLGVNILGKK